MELLSDILTGILQLRLAKPKFSFFYKFKCTGSYKLRQNFMSATKSIILEMLQLDLDKTGMFL